MYLHLGQDIIVNERDIVGVFDLDNSTISRHTPGVPLQSPEGGPGGERVHGAAKILYRVRKKNGQKTVYISQISTATLLRRASGRLPLGAGEI